MTAKETQIIFQFLMKKAIQIPDDTKTFYSDPIDGEFVSIWDGGTEEIVTPCKVDLSTFRVYDIQLCSEKQSESVTTLDGEYVRLFGNTFQQYPVLPKEKAQEDLYVMDFWRD